MRLYTTKHYRRLGLKKGDTAKDPTIRRNYPPGVHGPKGRKRLTDYGMQLAEKQKAKVLYNISEKQFRSYYAKAASKTGNTGNIMLTFLEKRLDNVVFRAGFAKTRPMARQMVNHGLFTVNGKKVNIPSYQLRVKDIIAIKENKQGLKLFEHLQETLKNYEAPQWLHINPTDQTITVVNEPGASDAEQAFNTQSIIEFYSR